MKFKYLTEFISRPESSALVSYRYLYKFKDSDTMMLKTIKVSGTGQISIPNEMRQNLGISIGDEIIIIETAGKLIIEKQENVVDRFEDIIEHNQESLREVWDNPEDDIWNQYLK